MINQLLHQRKDLLPNNLSISYENKRPLIINKVGHCHPKVVEAGAKQLAILNTNTRYLNSIHQEYAKTLLDTFPKPLTKCFFVNSGSEANDLALRLARTYTKKKDIIVIDGAYHGHLTSLIEISPYKFEGKGGFHCKEYVHKATIPDTFRGIYKTNDETAGIKYAHDIENIINNLESKGKYIGAFIAESILGCAGQIVLPKDYLKTVYNHVRKVGAVCIADEIQVGFGRIGSHFWAFESQDVIPDIVTLGKPIGNGFPMAAVITSAAIANAFDNGMEYFNTFGGCNVACATGIAVLNVIKEEDLQLHALNKGQYFLHELLKLKEKHKIIGDCRGLGLFIGIELVKDRESLSPATKEAEEISYLMMDKHKILISTDGPFHNIIKIKPPLCISQEDIIYFISSLDDILQENFNL